MSSKPDLLSSKTSNVLSRLATLADNLCEQSDKVETCSNRTT
jgi:hypothetical protein